MIDIARVRELWPETCHGRWMSEEYAPGLVSVIMPTYNRAPLIEGTLDSTWQQTYRPVEVLVVDDGSLDNTPEVVNAWIERHKDDPGFEIHYFFQEKSPLQKPRFS